MKYLLTLISVLALSMSAYAQQANEDMQDENLPVKCGSLMKVLDAAKNKFNEEPVATWIDPRYGRYLVLSNAEGTSVTLLLAVRDVEDAVCIVSYGDQFMQAPAKPKATL